MADVLDVAKYALAKLECVSTMKLQKIVFYSNAYHLAKRGCPLFHDRIEAWVNGPVIPALFQKHRGEFVIFAGFFDDGKEIALSVDEKRSIDHVVRRLKGMSGAALSELTHSEAPWQIARKGCKANERSNTEISQDSIRAFYSSAESCKNPVFA